MMKPQLSHLRYISRLVFLSCLLLFLVLGTDALFNTPVAHAAGTSYYLDCSATSNGSGTQASPWNTLTSVNSTTFVPGDNILLKSGTACNGQLAPLGSGSSGSPITISNYGTGALPSVNAAGLTEGAVVLTNQSYWTIKNIAVTNDATTEARRSGLLIQTTNTNIYHSITILGLDVHNVKGVSDRNNINDFYSNSGIMFNTAGPIQGIDIESNTTHDMTARGIGIFGSGVNTNVLIKNNTVYNVGTDGIVVCQATSPIVENNVVYAAGTNAVNAGAIAGIWAGGGVSDPLFQYNEVAHTLASNDSEAWDCDGGVTGACIYQYNYDHDNYGGIYLQCEGCVASTSDTQIFRYNISQNDCRIVNDGGNVTNFSFYNNDIYCPNTAFNINFPPNTFVSNNIFIGKSGASLPTSSGITYNSNTYSGFNGPSDPHGLSSDPLFVNPGAGTDGMTTVDGYKLSATSPDLGNGVVISNNGGLDYWQNSVSATAAPNRGAYNGAGVVIPTPTYYKIVNRNSGQVMDVYQASTADSGSVVQWGYTGGLNQQWHILDEGNGYFELVNRNSGKVLDVNNASTNDGGALIQFTDHSTNNQQWTFVSVGGGYSKIVNRNSGKVVAVPASSTTQGAQLIQWTDAGIADQQWQFVPVG